MLSRPMLAFLLLSGFPALSTVAASSQQAVYLDTKLTPSARAHDLVGRMTLD